MYLTLWRCSLTTKHSVAWMAQPLHARLVSAVTQYDQKEEAKAIRARARGKNGYHNHYALGHYLQGIERAEQLIAEGRTPREALIMTFSGRLQDAVLDAAGEARGSDAEVRTCIPD